MTLVRKSPNRLPAVAMVAALAVGLSPTWGSAQTPPRGSEGSWQLRARVKIAPGASPSGPRMLPQAVDLVHQAACGHSGDLLGDGAPLRTRIQLTLWRQPGPTDATRTGRPDMTCHIGAERISAFRLRGRVAGGGRWVDASASLNRLAEVANAAADRMMATGGDRQITLRLGTGRKPVRGMVRSLARRHEVSVTTAMRVAACESHFNPRAYSHPYAGVYQQDVRFWGGRARRFGHPGESPFDPYANVEVSLKMARAMGWGHWGCA
jgi:hypothetical protein